MKENSPYTSSQYEKALCALAGEVVVHCKECGDTLRIEPPGNDKCSCPVWWSVNKEGKTFRYESIIIK